MKRKYNQNLTFKTLIAFGLTVLLGTIVFSTSLAFLFQSDDKSFMTSVYLNFVYLAALSFLFVILLGLPIYILFQTRGWKSYLVHFLAGLIIGGVGGWFGNLIGGKNNIIIGLWLGALDATIFFLLAKFLSITEAPLGRS